MTDTTLHAVEVISTFRLVYLVRAKNASDAADAVASEEAQSSFQKHLGEMIVRSYEVSDGDAVKILQETEQPTMTLEKLQCTPLLKNCTHIIEY